MFLLSLQACMVLAILAHNVCSVYSMFAAKLLMHMCFACMALEVSVQLGKERYLDIQISCKALCSLNYRQTWQKEAGSSTHLLHHIHQIQGVLGYHEVDISADEITTLAEDGCAWRNLVITCSTAEG